MMTTCYFTLQYTKTRQKAVHENIRNGLVGVDNSDETNVSLLLLLLLCFLLLLYVTLDICVSSLTTVTIVTAVTYVTLVTCIDSAPAHYTTRVLPVQRVVNLL